MRTTTQSKAQGKQAKKTFYKAVEYNLMCMYKRVKNDVKQQDNPLTLKYFEDILALLTFQLNADGEGFKKRMVRLNSSSTAMYEFLTTTTGNVSVLVESSERESSEMYVSYAAKEHLIGLLRDDYTFFSDMRLFETISNPAWKKYRKQSRHEEHKLR
jgi:hypothetical protein